MSFGARTKAVATKKRIEDYNRFKDYIHPHINDCIDHYGHKNIIHLPACHGCDTVINYERRSQCFDPTDK